MPILPQHPGFYSAVELLRDEIASFDDYPFSIPAIAALDTLKLHPRVTFFVGENGSGKSTLIEALAVKAGCNPEGGGRNFDFSTRDSTSTLSRYLRVHRPAGMRPSDTFFLRAESFFNVATEIERLGAGHNYGQKSLHEQSHGESFFALLNNRLFGDGFYIFDEPESALSPQRQLSMLIIIENLLKEGSQLVIATHSPILLAYPEAWIYQLDGHGIQRIAYTETEHYRVTRDFLNRHEQMLAHLLDRLPLREER